MQIETELEYAARVKREETEQASQEGNWEERREYDFSDKRLTVTNYKNIKSDKISSI